MITKFVMDVDGTLTDGKIYIASDGEAMKAFSVKDGYGIHDMLIPNGISPVVLTGRDSLIVKKRCEELGITEVYQGIRDKVGTLRALVKDLSCVAYIGDDLNDLECMRAVKEARGLVGCPADASAQVIEIADFVAPHKGGEGAVRDFVEWILEGRL